MPGTGSSLPKLRLHWSVLLVAALIVWGLANGVLPAEAPGFSPGSYWFGAVAVAIAFFASLVVHELAHSVVARRHGQQVRAIRLWALGGVAELEGDATSPGAEFRMAVVGPLASLAIAGALGALDWAFAAAGGTRLLVASLGWLAGANALLAVFNLLPAFPLDGGRVLRATLWWILRDRRRATAWAAGAGRVLGAGMVGLGLAGLAFFGMGWSGIWLAVIGTFVFIAAGAQAQAAETDRALGSLTVREVARPVVTAPADLSLDRVVEEWIRPYRLPLCPLVDWTGRVTGVVTMDSIREVPASAWPFTPAQRVALPVAAVVTCQTGEAVSAVARRLSASSVGGALVFEGYRLFGLLTPQDIHHADMWRGTRDAGGAFVGPLGGQPR